MKKPIKIYEAFQIVTVPFPFIDTGHVKKRPALVLSTHQNFNKEAQASVMAMITSAIHSPWPLDAEITDLKSAGLPMPSLVRMKIFTLDHRLILGYLGKLSLQDTDTVHRCLQKLLPQNGQSKLRAENAAAEAATHRSS